MTVYGTPLSAIIRPTAAGSEPNRRVHAPSERTTTGAAPATASEAAKARPIAGADAEHVEERRRDFDRRQALGGAQPGQRAAAAGITGDRGKRVQPSGADRRKSHHDRLLPRRPLSDSWIA